MNSVYDLVYSGATQKYVAMTDKGAVILTSASTGPNMVARSGTNLVTSIFSTDCDGKITISYNGATYQWASSGAVTTMTKTSPANVNMIA